MEVRGVRESRVMSALLEREGFCEDLGREERGLRR